MERPGRDLAAKRTGETSTSGQLPSSLQALHDAVMAHLLPMQDALKEHPDVARALLRWWTACTRGAALGKLQSKPARIWGTTDPACSVTARLRCDAAHLRQAYINARRHASAQAQPRRCARTQC